ncbi:hypothetical protein AC579_647 [Pseudocercospora musae]|uniref:F-box domain-containing protein n=1 Tax=Pseudocercospora musae TaxID=113226 RepID=A0A139I995_9PEZI|nr:hypothetical protein AC579_647 [Pseudocercospora musae]
MILRREPTLLDDQDWYDAEYASNTPEQNCIDFASSLSITNDVVTAIGNVLLQAPSYDTWAAPTPWDGTGSHEAISDLNAGLSPKKCSTLSFLLRRMAKKIIPSCTTTNRILKTSRMAAMQHEQERQLWERFTDLERDIRLMYLAFLDEQARWLHATTPDAAQYRQPVGSALFREHNTYQSIAHNQPVRKPLARPSLRDKSTISFLDLPPEIRNQIYDSLAAETLLEPSSPWDRHCIQTHWTPRPGITTDLLLSPMTQVSGHIRSEFLPRWHRHIELSFDCNADNESNTIDRWLKAFALSRVPVTRSFNFLFGDDQVRIDLRGALRNGCVQKEKVKVSSPPVKLTRMLKARSKRPENFERNLQGFVEALLVESEGTVRVKSEGVRAIMQYLKTLQTPKRQVCLCEECVVAR